MKIEILYASMTGHSKKIAKELESQIGISPRDVKKIDSIPKSDLLILITGIYGGGVHPEMVRILEKTEEIDIGKVLLITSSTSKQSNKALVDLLSSKNITVAEEYICQGSFLFKAMGHPNKEERKEAISFVKKYL